VRAFRNGLIVGALAMFLVASSCHPFPPCRMGAVGGSVWVLCR